MLELNYQQKIIYNINLEIKTKFGILKKAYKDINSEYKDLFNKQDELDIFADLVDFIDIKTHNVNRFYLTFVTRFNSKGGYEDHSLDLIIECDESTKFEYIKEFLGSDISSKYNLRTLDSKQICINNITNKTDIKSILLKIVK